MITTPFVRLPRRNYDPRLENVPRIDIEYLEEYQSDNSTESPITEESFRFSDGSDDSSESSFTPEDTAQYETEQYSDSEDSELERLAQDELTAAQEEASRISNFTSKTKKAGRWKKIKNFIRRRPAYIKFQQWRKKNAEERRHAMIRRYEKLAAELPGRYREEILQKIEEDEMVVRKHAKKLGRIQKTHLIRAQAKHKKNAKFEHEKAVRKKEQKRLEFNVFHMQMWALENHERKKVERAMADARKQQEAADRALQEEKEARLAFERRDDGKLQEDIDETQRVWAIGRAAGALRGVNAASHKVIPEAMRETDRKLFVRIRDDVDFSYKPKHMRSKESLMPFDVDLRLFNDVEVLVGVGIGERGALALSAEFVRGSCSNVLVLDLSRCMIHSRGFGRLLHGLRIGRVVLPVVLSAAAEDRHEFKIKIALIMSGLTNGSLANLRTLDLRENELGDDGADKIAHMMIVEVFATISVLRLQRNRISDDGVKKIVNVLRAVIDVKCPNLTKVSLEENIVSNITKLKLRPLPRGVSV